MPVRVAKPQRHKRGEVQQQAREHQPPWAVGIKHGADLDAAEEDHEVVDAEYPAALALGDVAQLVRGDPGLVDADAVHEAEAAHDGAEAAKDDEVGGPPALGVL